ncbi:MAG: hypothetical protein HY923_03685 [Elusimicrobia bacterium]|nr:hypothetical protein [Elusimicrobiota bacterium]
MPLAGVLEGYRPEALLREDGTPHRRPRQRKYAALDLRVELQQVKKIRQADPADARLARERGLAQARGAIEPAAVLQGLP